jgi:hypothetical protein
MTWKPDGANVTVSPGLIYQRLDGFKSRVGIGVLLIEIRRQVTVLSKGMGRGTTTFRALSEVNFAPRCRVC